MTVSQQASAEITCQTWSVIHRLCPETLAIISQLHPDLPKDCKQAWMSSSQLAPLVRCPRAMAGLPGVLWLGVGLWNLWGRTGGETLDLELHPGATLLKKIQHKYSDAADSLSYWKCIYLWIQEYVGLHEPVLEWRLWNNAWIYLFNCHKNTEPLFSIWDPHPPFFLCLSLSFVFVFCDSLFWFPSLNFGKCLLIADIHFKQLRGP